MDMELLHTTRPSHEAEALLVGFGSTTGRPAVLWPPAFGLACPRSTRGTRARSSRRLRAFFDCVDHVRSSLPGLTSQVGLARLAALNNAELGQARVPMQSIPFRKKMDARVKPAHDGGKR